MISEGLCDTEDWSNDAENSALPHRNKLHFNIFFNVIIFSNITVLLYFWLQKNAALLKIRDQKKIRKKQKHFNSSVYQICDLIWLKVNIWTSKLKKKMPIYYY